MNYKEIYYNLCCSRKAVRDVKKQEGYEVHHILPRSMGGSDHTDNLVKLTRREHILAHRLLVKFSKGRHYFGMLQAYLWMSEYNTHGEYLNTIRSHLTRLGYRKDKVFPLSEVNSILDNKASPMLHKAYRRKKKLQHVKLKKGYANDIFLFLLYSANSGFDRVSNMAYGKSSRGVEKYFKELNVLDQSCNFTEDFKTYAKEYSITRLKKFEPRPYHCGKILKDINLELSGVKIFISKLKKGKWLFYKINDTETPYDHLLYKPLGYEEVKSVLIEK